MAKKIEILTDIAIRNLKPGPKAREHADGKGLFYKIEPSGVRSWTCRYRIGGRPAKATLSGSFSLKEARLWAEESPG